MHALLNAHASVVLTDKRGYTALAYAASSGHVDVVKTLLAHPGVAPTQLAHTSGPNPLGLAARAGRVDVLAALIEAGADVNGANTHTHTHTHTHTQRERK